MISISAALAAFGLAAAIAPFLPAPGPARKVSVHVPCYAEPPEVVNATLDALARQDHDDFEVIVVDNNTKDESLGRTRGGGGRPGGVGTRASAVDRLETLVAVRLAAGAVGRFPGRPER